MDRYLETDERGYRPFSEEYAFDRVMALYWSEHDVGDDFDRDAFESAVSDAIDISVWHNAFYEVGEAQSDHHARRDMWRYNGVRQRDYYGT